MEAAGRAGLAYVEPAEYAFEKTVYAAGDLAGYIDHTLLKPEASRDEIDTVCEQALKYAFASVCVNPNYAKQVARKLSGSGIKTCCVIGFPFGTHAKEIKAAETEKAIDDGAEEVDMVIDIANVKNGDWRKAYEDIRAVVEAADRKALVKVIIETALLTDEEKVGICTIARLAGADYVKTSTGYSKGGATAEDVELINVNPVDAILGDEGIVAKYGGELQRNRCCAQSAYRRRVRIHAGCRCACRRRLEGQAVLQRTHPGTFRT